MEKIIWQNYDINVEDWKDDFIYNLEENNSLADYLIDNDYNIDDDDVLEWAYDMNGMYLDDERINLNINIGMPIIVIADIGRWNGRASAYKVIKSGNIADCLYSECDYCKWYCDDKDFRFEGSHHDGNNHYRYRAISEENLELLEYGEIELNTECAIEHYTYSLRPHIANVYWE